MGFILSDMTTPLPKKAYLNPADLDTAEPSDLMLFWAHYQNGRNFRELFPAGGKGSKRAAADIANYAANRATAAECRLRGDIEHAFLYERYAERIYADLPSFARF